MKFTTWFRCRFQKKHKYSYYTDQCIVCGKKRKNSDLPDR